MRNTNPKVMLLLLVLVLCKPILNAQYVIGKSYYDTDSFIEYIPGSLPIILVAPHGGRLEPDSLPVVVNRGRDNGTLDLSYLLLDSILKQTGGCRPHIIINHLHPTILNAARNKLEAAGSHPSAQLAFDEFHAFIEDAKKEVNDKWGAGHYFELHGNGRTDKRNEIGLGLSKYHLFEADSAIVKRVDFSTVKHICTAGKANFLEVLKGKSSLGGLLDSMGWKSMPSPQYPSPDTAEGFFYAGWNTWEHGSRYSGTIDATHIESHWSFMTGTNKEPYAGDMAHAIIAFTEIHYAYHLDCSAMKTEQLEANVEVQIYPNPVHGESFIQFLNPEKMIDFRIFTSQGSIVKTTEVDRGFKLTNAPAGVYFMHLKLTNGSTSIKRLTIL